MFSNHFTTNFPQNTAAVKKNIWKSVNILQRFCLWTKLCGLLFFWATLCNNDIVRIFMYLVDLFVLPTPTAWWCRRSGCQLLPTQPSFPGGRPTNLEWSTGWSDVRWIVDHIPPATENSPFFQNHFPVISWTL